MLVEGEQLHLAKLKMLCFKEVGVMFWMCVLYSSYLCHVLGMQILSNHQVKYLMQNPYWST